MKNKLLALFSPFLLFGFLHLVHFYFNPYDSYNMCDCIGNTRIKFKMIDYDDKQDSFKNLKRYWLKYEPKGKVYWGNCETLKTASIKELKNRHSKILSVK